MVVNFQELDDSVYLKFSVIVAEDENGFVFVKHQNRDTWEIPGGHIEVGETPEEAASRELKEETGALDFTIQKICNYSVTIDDSTTSGRLFFAKISRYADSLDFEIEKVNSFPEIPDDLTYPGIQPFLFKEVVKRITQKGAANGSDIRDQRTT